MIDGTLNHGNLSSQIWSGLGKDVRQQAIQVLAELAFKVVMTQAPRLGKQEQDHVKARRRQS